MKKHLLAVVAFFVLAIPSFSFAATADLIVRDGSGHPVMSGGKPVTISGKGDVNDQQGVSGAGGNGASPK